MRKEEIEKLDFVSVAERLPENGECTFVYIKRSNGGICKGMYYKNGLKPTFASYGSEVEDVVAWAPMKG